VPEPQHQHKHTFARNPSQTTPSKIKKFKVPCQSTPTKNRAQTGPIRPKTKIFDPGRMHPLWGRIWSGGWSLPESEPENYTCTNATGASGSFCFVRVRFFSRTAPPAAAPRCDNRSGRLIRERPAKSRPRAPVRFGMYVDFSGSDRMPFAGDTGDRNTATGTQTLN
jgi:hypothetical protein